MGLGFHTALRSQGLRPFLTRAEHRDAVVRRRPSHGPAAVRSTRGIDPPWRAIAWYGSLVYCAPRTLWTSSFLRLPKKLSIGALSRQSPRLVEQRRHRAPFPTRKAAKRAVFEYVEGFYNRSSERTSGYVVDARKLCCAGSGTAGCFVRIVACWARIRAARLSRAARLNTHGPSARGCTALTSPRSAAKRRVRAATPMRVAAWLRFSQTDDLARGTDRPVLRWRPGRASLRRSGGRRCRPARPCPAARRRSAGRAGSGRPGGRGGCPSCEAAGDAPGGPAAPSRASAARRAGASAAGPHGAARRGPAASRRPAGGRRRCGRCGRAARPPPRPGSGRRGSRAARRRSRDTLAPTIRHSRATAWFARSAATKANLLTRSPGRKKRPPS